MEGLEINIKKLSELTNDKHSTFRFDSEHYQKKYQTILNKIRKHKSVELKELITQPVITGHTPSMKIERYYGGKIKFIKTDNLRENKIVPDFTHFLSEEGNSTRKNSQLRIDDILTTIIGATYEIVGRTSIVQKEILPANINQNIALIRADSKKINSHYLNIYLNTKFGRNMLYYHSRQTEQVNLNCREVERILIPIFDKIQIKIEEIVRQIESLKKHHKKLFSESVALLLKDIGLDNFSPSQEGINIKTLSNSFLTNGRLDAEYYQPKYDDYNRLSKNYYLGSGLLSNVCHLKDKNYKPNESNTYQYIELSNIGKTGDINGHTTSLGSELPSRARRKVITGDVIISSIEGSLDSCAIITEEYNNSLCSTGFYVIKSEQINPETLLVLFKSELMQNILKQNCSGTILTAINKSEFLNLPIPIINENIQLQIRSKIIESFALKKQSEHLLEVAKRAVEIAIEEGEDNGLEYINLNTKNLN